MKAIYKRELRSYFTSMTGFVFLAFMLAFAGIYFSVINIYSGYPYFGYTLSSVTMIFLLIVPVLTMKVFAEERRQKTDQMLFTAPVSVTGVVLGKYLAMLTILLLASAILAVFPVIMGRYGTVSYPMTYTALLGFFLLGATLIAIGMFVSSLTESQVISAVLTFLILFLSMIMDSIVRVLPSSALASYFFLLVVVGAVGLISWRMTQNTGLSGGIAAVGAAILTVCFLVKRTWFEDLIGTILSVFGMNSRLENFVSGILDLTAVVYYLSLTGLFVFLTVQSIQKRRWS